MTELDFHFIEDSLEIKLPESYKMLMQREKTIDYILPTAKKVVETNLRLRKKGFRGKRLYVHHLIIGYDKESRDYYFLDLEKSESPVYLCNNTKTWMYSPDDLQKNYMRAYSSLPEFVGWFERLDERKTRNIENPPPELTDEQKREKREVFLAELRRKREEQNRKKATDDEPQ